MMNNLLIPILSTKILPPHTIQAAKAKGLDIECISFIETKPIINESLSAQINEWAKGDGNIIFTSVNAVHAVAAMVQHAPQWRIFCIYGRTKDAVEQKFPQARIIASAKYGKELVSEIIRHKEIKSVTFFCGNKRLDLIPDELPKHQINVKEIVVYETLLTPQRIKKDYKAVLFFSPSGVESFFSMNNMDKNVVPVSIGTTTTSALKNLITNTIYTSETVDVASMISLASSALKNA